MEQNKETKDGLNDSGDELDSLDAPESLEQKETIAPAADARNEEQEAAKPLYSVSDASTPSISPDPSRSSLFSNNGKYSFVGATKHKKIAMVFLSVFAILLLAAGGLMFLRNSDDSGIASLSEHEVVALSDEDLLSIDTSGLQTEQQILINGPLQVKDSFVLSPSSQPQDASAGQLFFDSQTNSFVFYDGTLFQTIVNQRQLEELADQIAELQGGMEAVEIPEFDMPDEIVNRIQGTPNQVLVSALTGNVTLRLPQNIHTAASPTFAGMNLSQLQVGETATISEIQAGLLTLSQPLGLQSGGTGSDSSSYDSYGVLYYDGSRFATTNPASASGMCFVSTAGAPSFVPCNTIDFAVVKTVNGLTGSLTISNAETSGLNTITIRDATTNESGLLSATNQRIAGLKTFTAGISINNGNAIESDGGFVLRPAVNRDLTIATSGSGSLVIDNMDCSAFGNGGKLTVDANGNVICSEDTGGDGVGLTSVHASDESIAIDITDGNNPGIAVNTRAGGGLSTSASGIGLTDACEDNQILKYNSATGTWFCSDDIGEENPVAECPTCVALQEDTPGDAQEGHINVTGTIMSGNSRVSGDSFVGGEFTTNGSALIQSSINSETAFQVQNAAGSSLINSDTSHMSVTIGSLSSPTTPKIGDSLPPAPIGSVGTGYEGASSNVSEPRAVAVNGNFAYTAVSTRNVVQIADISNPENPEYVVDLGIGANSNPSDVVTYGNYLYVLARGANQLKVYDISDENPMLTTNVSNVSITGSSESMTLHNNYIFIASGNSRLQVIDLSNPANPTVKYTAVTAAGSDGVAVKDNHAYVTQWSSNRLEIFDISDLQNSAPTSVGRVTTNSGPRRIDISGNYAYVVNSTAGNMQTFDLSNPANPTAVDSVATGAHPYSVHATGDAVLVASYSGKSLQVFTLSNPADPTSVGSIPTSRNAVYVTYAQGYAFVTGSNNGLNGILEIFSLGGSSDTLTVFGNTSIVGRISATSAEFGGNVAVGSLTANATVSANSAVYTPQLDTLIAGALQLGSNNATAINLNQNTTIGVGKTLAVQGETTITADATNALSVNDGGNNSYLRVDTSTKNISIGNIGAPSSGSSGGGDLPASHESSTPTGGIFPLAVATDGDYAYVAGMVNLGGPNFLVMDISDPHNPSNIGSAATSAFLGSFPSLIAAENDHAYVIAGNNLDIFDVRNPSSPSRVSNSTVQGSSISYGVGVSGDYAYVVYKNSSDQAYINVVDVTNKAAPSTIHSQYLGANASELYIDIDGSFAYIAKKGTGALFSEIIVLDISNPTGGNLPLKRLAFNGNAIGATPEAIVAKNGYAYVPFSDARAMQVFDATDHANPPVVRGTSSISSTPMNIAVSDSGNFVYLTDGTANTLRLINVANPDNPTNIGTVASGGQTEGVAVAGGAVYVANRGDNTIFSYDFGSGGNAASISLNQNTVLASGRTLTAQGDTNIKTDSMTALQVQNAANESALTVDTVNGIVIAGSAFAVGEQTGIDIDCDMGDTLTNIKVTGGIITDGTCGESSAPDPDSVLQAANGLEASSVDAFGAAALSLGSSNATEINLNQDTTIAEGKNLTVQGNTSILTDSEEALAVQDSETNTHFLIDTANNRISIGIDNGPPEAPSEGGDFTLPTEALGQLDLGQQPSSMSVKDNYAFVASSSDNNIRIIDTSDPTNPSEAGNYSISSPDKLTVDGDYLYVANSNNLAILDITNPTSPSLVKNVSITARYTEAISVQDGFVYILETWDFSLVVVDARDPANATAVGTTSFGWTSNALGMGVYGDYAYVTEASNNRVSIVDTSSRNSPGVSNMPIVGSFATNASPRAARVLNGHLYITNIGGTAQLQIYDLTNPTSPSLIGSVDTGAQPYDVTVADNGEFALVTNYSSNTLQAIDITDITEPTSLGSVSTGTGPITTGTNGTHAYVANQSSKTFQVFSFGESGSETEGPSTPSGGIDLNQDTTIAEGRLFTVQGDTVIKTDSESALQIQNAAGGNLMSVDTINSQIKISGDLSIQNDSVTALDIQTSAGESILTVNTNDGTLTVAGNSIFRGDITVEGHVITDGDTPGATAQSAAGTGATCTVTGNDSSGTITITAGSESLADGGICVLTFSKPYAGTPRPLVSPLNKSSAEAGPYVTADSTTLTLSFAQPPVAGQTYNFNYWNVE